MGCVKCNIERGDHFEGPSRSIRVHLGDYDSGVLSCSPDDWYEVVTQAIGGTMSAFLAALADAFGSDFVAGLPKSEPEGGFNVRQRLKTACSRP
jgi:hypothetical protein